MRKIAIMGVGVVGSALYNYLSDDVGNEFLLYDPARELYGEFEKADLAFICVPVPTLADRSQDLKAIEYCLEKLQKSGKFFGKLIFLKSTVLPETCEYLGKKYMLKIIHMPEFLTERTSQEDMIRQDIVCGGREILTYSEMSMIKELFYNKKIHFMRNTEAELAKYAHNCFAAMKVNFFNIINQASHILGAEYQKVLEGIFVSGYINKDHTQVPGPDHKFGYGGKCFPKDLSAFIGLLIQKHIFSASLEATEKENQFYRELT